ncbi:MAG TPA: SMP-30/gluconolactonase/LRE family protein [Rhizomicrobium sp.]|jgi:gluconolactonase|nr:SMP-30/gluconolactonase/LRE family protein [Rhizomicrobium sp.]
MTIREIASGLRFPEGPVAMEDGSLIVCEIATGRLTRIKVNGETQTIAEPGGGPNGLAIGPDGAIYICNNGGSFTYIERQGLTIPGHAPEDHVGGRIERVDISTGKLEILYESWGGERLIAPNDLVFDESGGFWFTDYGRGTRVGRTHGALYYAKADGSKITQVLRELITPNGVGLSPDNRALYFAETLTARLWSLPLVEPGAAAKKRPDFVGTHPALAYFDSLGVQADGAVCVATILAGGITTFWPGTKRMKHRPLPDSFVTNICWGGKTMKTAYITLSGTGKLIAMDWPKPGLPLNYSA